MMIEICSSNLCTGCGMCSDFCPQNAIVLREGKHGFVYPEVDNSVCVDCKGCQNICPQNNNSDIKSEIESVYAAWGNDLRLRMSDSLMVRTMK